MLLGLQDFSVADIVATFVAALAFALAVLDHWTTRDHQRRSVRPLPFISPWDYEDHLKVTLHNNGTGPLMVRRLTALKAVPPIDATPAKIEQCKSLFEAVTGPPDDDYFSDYCTISDPGAVLPGDRLILLDYELDPASPTHANYRDLLRSELGAITLLVEYTDIYDQEFAIYEKKLTWFNRLAEV
jgi:hypothetical protein